MSGDPVFDAIELAKSKANAVVSDGHMDAIVIGADTIVHDGTRAYSKPVSDTDAVAMLSTLRGRTHRVVTGVAVMSFGRVAMDHSTAEVTLSNLADVEVETYVASGRPADKAGAYAIQDEDVPTVSRLEGCYCGVMGLPLWKLRELLMTVGVECASPELTFERCAACPERPLLPAGAKSATIRR